MGLFNRKSQEGHHEGDTSREGRSDDWGMGGSEEEHDSLRSELDTLPTTPMDTVDETRSEPEQEPIAAELEAAAEPEPEPASEPESAPEPAAKAPEADAGTLNKDDLRRRP